MIFETFFAMVAAIILFLYGIEQLSRGLQKNASETMRSILAKFTSNRWTAAVFGAFSTALLQSSSATSMIVVGLVNSGILSFRHSLGVIAGANVGTTITAFLVAFKFSEFAPFFIVLGFLISIAGGRFRVAGKPIFYFGFLFFAITLISTSIQPFKQDPALLSFLASLNNPFYGFLAGILFTIAFQSSSVMTGIVILLGLEGLVDLQMAIPILLGANIGTTATAMLSSYNMDAFAKRTALANLLFNVFGVLIFFPFIGMLAEFVSSLGGGTAQMIATAHMVFNVSTTVLFLAILPNLTKLIERMVPSRQKEILFETKYLDELPDDASNACKQILRELQYELTTVRELFGLSYSMLWKGKAKDLNRAVKLESLSDFLDDKVFEALVELSKRPNIDKNQASAISKLSRVSHEIEQLADLGRDFGDLAVRLEEIGKPLPADHKSELSEIVHGFEDNLALLNRSLLKLDKEGLENMREQRVRVDRNIGRIYAGHIKKLADPKTDTSTSAVYLEAVAIVEHANSTVLRIGRHLESVNRRLTGTQNSS